MGPGFIGVLLEKNGLNKNIFKQVEGEVVPSSSLVEVGVEVGVGVEVEVVVEVVVEVGVEVEVVFEVGL